MGRPGGGFIIRSKRVSTVSCALSKTLNFAPWCDFYRINTRVWFRKKLAKLLGRKGSILPAAFPLPHLNAI